MNLINHKKLIVTFSFLFLGLNLIHSQELKNKGLDAQMPRYYMGVGLFGGTAFSSIQQSNWNLSYLNAVNANISDMNQSGAHHLGMNLSFGYYLGKARNFGLGTGIQYLYSKSNYEVNQFAIEYQSNDASGTVFRQVLRSNGALQESIKQTNLSLPLMLLYKKQLNEKWGLNMDLGMIFHLSNKVTYETENTSMNYEAIYSFDNNGNPVYDNSPVPNPNDWLITKAHYEKVNSDGNVNAYFEDLYGKGYNVGLGINPANKGGQVSNSSVSVSWFIRPGMSYRIKPNLALHGNLLYQHFTTNYESVSNYRTTDKRGSYSSMSNGMKSTTAHLMSFGVGIRYYFGKEKVEKPLPPPPPPAPAPLVKEPVKEDPYKEMVKVMVKLQDEKYAKPVPGNIVIKKANKVVFNGQADQSGISNFYLEPGDYVIGVTAKAYIPAEENLSLKANEKGTSKLIELKQPKIEKGLVFKLKAINFETGSNQLTPGSNDILDKMADMLLEYPQMVIEVAGHTDNVGDDQKNLVLSENRAKSVAAYLLAKGVKASQLKSKGYGETIPVASNDTEEGRLQNRRVVFTVEEF